MQSLEGSYYIYPYVSVLQLCNDSEIRIKFKAYREFEVMHSLPVSIKAYDYYEPGIIKLVQID